MYYFDIWVRTLKSLSVCKKQTRTKIKILRLGNNQSSFWFMSSSPTHLYHRIWIQILWDCFCPIGFERVFPGEFGPFFIRWDLSHFLPKAFRRSSQPFLPNRSGQSIYRFKARTSGHYNYIAEFWIRPFKKRPSKKAFQNKRPFKKRPFKTQKFPL